VGIVLGDNTYGKAETRLVRIDRSTPEHRITDLNVSISLAGDLAATHLTGDNTGVLPTDTQKNTVYAFARDGIGEIEDFALRLARHFVATVPAITRARVHIERYGWERLGPHSFRRVSGVRTATAVVDGPDAWLVSGVTELVVLNTTDSAFRGFLADEYTTLAETDDRILATAVDARWRQAGLTADWADAYAATTGHLLAAFAETPSESLQQTLYAMGQRVLAQRPEVAEVRLVLPNRHHFLVDLAPFGLDNPGEVFYAADRPYGLIEGTVLRDDAPPAGSAWW